MWTQHPASYGRGLGSGITRVLGKALDQATIAGNPNPNPFATSDAPIARYRRERNPIWV
jgi:hypothetical protein